MLGKIIKLAVLAGAAFVAGGYTQKTGGTYDKVEAFGKDMFDKGKRLWNKFTKKAEETVEEVKEKVEEAVSEEKPAEEE